MSSWTVPRALLAEAMKIAARATTTDVSAIHQHIEVQFAPHVIGVRGTGTAGTTSLWTDGTLAETGKLYLHHTVAGIVDALTGDEITLTEEDSVVVLKTGRSEIRVPSFPWDATFPVVPKPEDSVGTITLRTLGDVAKMVCPFVVDQSEKGVEPYQAVFLDGDGWSATDRYRLSYLIHSADLGNFGTLVPVKLITEFESAARRMGNDATTEVTIWADDQLVAFEVERLTMTSPSVHGQQMEWRSQLQDVEAYASIDQGVITAAMNRISMTFPSTVYLAFRNDKVVIVGLNQSGISRETIACVYDGQEQVQQFNLDKLTALMKAAGTVVRLGPPESPEKILSVRSEGNREWKAAAFPQRIDNVENANKVVDG